MRVIGLDHVVIMSADVERSLAWYRDVLGLEPMRVEEWRAGDAPFPSVRVSAETIIDLFDAAPDGRNVDHVCLVVEPTDLTAVADRTDVEVLAGPSPRFGARGTGWSIYLQDPDGTVVEVRHYGAEPTG